MTSFQAELHALLRRWGWRVTVPLDITTSRPVRYWLDPLKPDGEPVGDAAAVSRELHRERELFRVY